MCDLLTVFVPLAMFFIIIPLLHTTHVSTGLRLWYILGLAEVATGDLFIAIHRLSTVGAWQVFVVLFTIPPSWDESRSLNPGNPIHSQGDFSAQVKQLVR